MTCGFGLSRVLRAAVVAAGLLVVGVTVDAQTTATKVFKTTTKPTGSSASARPAVTPGTNGGSARYSAMTGRGVSNRSNQVRTQVKTTVYRAPASGIPNTVVNAPAAKPLGGIFHPHPTGPPSTIVDAVDFGPGEVAGTAVTRTLSYAYTGSSLTVGYAAPGTDFAAAPANCTTSGCSVVVTFTPKFPGTRSGWLSLIDSGGNVIYKTFLSGLGKAPQVRFDLGYYTGYNGFIDTAYVLAFGPDRSLYVAQQSGNGVLVRDPSGNFGTITVVGLGSASGIAVDGSGTVYLADSTNNRVIGYTSGNSQIAVNTSQLSSPSQLAVDGSGALYIADTGNGRILKVDNQGVETTLASGLTMPTAVAVDSAGKVYYADQAQSGEIFTIAPGSTTSALYQNFINQTPRSLAVDAAGTIYLTTDSGLNRFYPGSQISTGDYDLDSPYGLAIDPNGGIAFTTPGRNTFTTVDPSSANFILSAPPGEQTSGTFTISNTGNEPLTLSNLAIDLPQYTFDPTSVCQNGTVLATEARCDVTVDFTPPSAMAFNGKVLVSSDSLHAQGQNGTFFLYGSGQGNQSHTDLTAAPHAVMVGNPVRLFATVVDDGANTNPTGTVTFYDGSTVLGTGTLAPPNETVQITVTSLAVGSHDITAKYSGDTVVQNNTSNTETVVVTSGPPDPNHGISVSSHDYGNVTLGGSASFNVNYSQTSGQFVFERGGDDFSTSTNCVDGNCIVAVTFTPTYPGLRTGTLIKEDSGGGVISRIALYGVGLGPQLGFDAGTDSVSSDTLAAPTGIAVDYRGTMYISDAATHKVYVNFEGFGAVDIPNLGNPVGLAIDGNRKLYIADQGFNLIRTYEPAFEGAGSIATSPLSGPTGVAVDGPGNVYITDTGNNRVLKVTPQGVETTIASGIPMLGPITVDSAGNIFFGTTIPFSAPTAGVIYEVPAAGGAPVQVANSISTLHGLAIDAGGRIYFANDAGLSILAPNGSSGQIMGYDFPGNASSYITGVTLAPNGDVYATDANTAQYFYSQRGIGNMYAFTAVGTPKSISEVVSNTGNTPLTISAVSVNGPTFTLNAANNCTAGTVVAPQNFCSPSETFNPTQVGETHEYLTITSNNLNIAGNTNTYDLWGEASAPSGTTSATLTVSPSAVQSGHAVRFFVTVTSNTASAPTGTVNFVEGSTVLGTATLTPAQNGSPSATATFTTSSLAVGVHTITAAYAGGSGFIASNSNSRTVTVTTGAPPANGGVMVLSTNFGTVAVGQQSANVTTVNLPWSGNYSAPATADFTLSGSVCNSSGCMVYVYFNPKFPGLRTDSIVQKDGNGNVIARAYLYGVGTGPQFGFVGGTEGFDTSITAPSGLAVGPNNALYIADAATNQIHGPSGAVLPIYNVGAVAGLALDGNGVLYIVDEQNGLVYTYDPATQVQDSLTTSALVDPGGVAVDGTGAVYISDTGNGRIIKLNNQGVESTIASGFAAPQGLTIDTAGNVIFADQGNNGELVKVPAAGGQPTVIVSNIGAVLDVAVDAAGTLYYTRSTPGIQILTPANVSFTAATGGTSYAVKLGANGDIFATQPLDGRSLHFTRNDLNTGGIPVSAMVGDTYHLADDPIINTGNTPLTLSGFALTNHTAFSIDPNTTCSVGTALVPGAVCDAYYDFHPTAAQTYSDTITFTSNSLNAPGSIGLNRFVGQGTLGTGTGASTTTVSASPSTAAIGQAVTLTATVTVTGNIPPSGRINFLDGGTIINSTTLGYQTSGNTATASFVTSALAAGTHSITAMYDGDFNFATSTSAAKAVTINAAPAVVSSQNFGSVAVGQSVTQTVTFNISGITDIRFAGGTDYSFTQYTCTSTSCSVPVKFAPQVPGQRSDALLVRDTNGSLLAKAYVYGTGTGPQFGFLPGSSTIDSNIAAPVAITFMQNGVGFVTDTATKKVYELVQGEPTLPLTGLGTPAGIAVDGSQVLYIADQTNNRIVTFDFVRQVQGSLTTSQLSTPTGVATDGAGSVYIADTGNNRVIKIDNQGVESVVATGLNAPRNVAVDAAGNVYYSDSTNFGQIVELPAGGGTPVRLTSSATGTITGIAVDPSGSVYYVGSNFSGIRDNISPTSAIAFSGKLTGSLSGIGINLNGDLWTPQQSTGKLEQLSRASTAFSSMTNVGTPKQHTVQVVNTGNAPLTLSNVAFATGTAFSLASGSPCAPGTVLQAGSECDTYVQFSPPAAQTYNDTLVYTTNTLNAAGSTNTDGESGTGTAPNPVPSTTTLAVNPATAPAGTAITLTATVADASGIIPTGTVTFVDGSTQLGTATLTGASAQSATASISISTLSIGSHSIRALYGGSTGVASSTSAAQTVAITVPPTVVTSKNFGNVAVGQSVSMNITYTQGTNPTITAVNNLDFVVSTVNCSTGCVATVTFVPQYPGTREDAVTVTDNNGNLLAKTFVYGTGTGPQFGFNVGSSTLNTTSFRQPAVVSVGPDGTQYVVDDYASTVLAGDGTSFTNIPFQGSGSAAVGGLAVNGSQLLYIATGNAVKSFDLRTGVTSTVATDALSQPGQLAVDGTGALYIADSGNGRVLKVDNQGVETQLARESQAILGLALDSAGNVFYSVFSGSNNVAIKEIPAGGGTPVVLTSALDSSVRTIAVDAAGKVYFVSLNGLSYISGGQAVSLPVIGLSGRFTGVAVGQDGALYVTYAGSTYAKVLRTKADNSTTPLSTTVGSTSTQHFTITNTGSSALTVSNVAITGGQPYTLDANSGCKVGTVIAATATCDGIVDFAPPQPQTYTADIVFTSNSLNSATSVNRYTVTGAGQSPQQVLSTTTLAASPSTAALGASITLTATIADTSAITPTGTVTFVDGTNPIGTGTLGSATGSGMATASLSVSSLAIGAHSIRALYGGSATVAASTSSAQTVTITQITTTTTVTASPASATAGQDVTLTATIAGRTSPAVSGLVTFFDGSTSLGNASVNGGIGGGSAQLTISSLSVGTHSITATYNGDTNYTASTSQPVTVTITSAGPAIDAKDFGSAAVNGGPAYQTLTYSIVPGGITLALANANDFTMQQTCNQNTCSATVAFAPKFPGLRTDALTVKDLNGNLIAKTFLYGTGTGPQFGFQPGLASQALAGLVTNPTGVAVGNNGTIYVSDTSNNRVFVQYASGGGGTVEFPTLGNPGGLAVDGSNTVYVADRTHNVILAANTSGVVRTVATSALSSPNALAVDGTGALYIADTGNNRIIKIDNQGVQTTVRTLTTAPLGIAVDAAMNVYYADAGNNGEVTMLNAGGFGSTTVSGLGATINALGVDASGRLYYTLLNGGISSLGTVKLGFGASVKYAISSATQAGAGLALDGSGRIIITEPSIGQVDVYARNASNASLTTQVGTQAQTTFTVANTGNTVLTIQNLAVGGTSGTISVDASGTCIIGATVPVGQTCTVTADFTPAAAQAYQGSILVQTDSLNTGSSVAAFTVFGMGTAAAASSTSLAVSANTVALGQPVTLTATVSFAGSQPSGTVNFFNANTLIGSATLTGASAGTATAQFTTSSLPVGSNSLTAMYAGNGTVPASVSGTQTVSVGQASTSTVLTVSPASVTVGQPETLTATITTATGTPALTGGVVFMEGSTQLGIARVTATATGGTASFTLSSLSVGPHNIQVMYSGDANFISSTSAAQTVTVTQVTTTATLAVSPASVALGSPETLTATIAGGTGTPAATGTVMFVDGTNQLGVVTVTATGTGATASLTLSTLALGPHNIRAIYSGDTNYIASTSAAQTVTVTQATSTTALSATPASLLLGQTETLRATVAAGSGSPAASGTVSYFDGTTLLGTANLTATGTGGTATLTLLTLGAGSHSITARYSGDTSYAASTSSAQTVTVSQASTTTTLAVSPATLTFGQTETLTASVQGLAAILPSGTVTFLDGATSLGSVTVSAVVQGTVSTARLTLSTLAVGSHNITARYDGDTNYTVSVSAAQTVTVTGTGTAQTITFPAISSHTVGDAPFTLNATASSGLAVTYTVVSGPAAVSGSTVTLTGTTGTVVIQATQAGNATYAAASPVSQSFAVLAAAPTLTSISPAGAGVGASATTITLTGTNFSTADTVQLNGSAIATTFVNATTLTAIVPASAQTAVATLQVTVFDSSNQQTTKAQTFTVTATPAVTFTGPSTTQPAQQPTVNVTLTNPYPTPLLTTLTLTFAPASSSLTDDPNVQFATGGRTQTFTIPANSTVTPAILLQSGTVAGRITVTLVLTSSGINVTPANVAPVVITIPPTVPAISTTGVARTGNLLTVSVHAFSNTREVKTAIFHFVPLEGYTVDTPDITADVSAAFAAWFASAASQQYGSSFTYAQDFNLTNDSSSIKSVTVTLVNSIGQSTVGTAQ